MSYNENKSVKAEEFRVSANNIKRCTRCALPVNWGITKLDDQGVCNHCHYYDTVQDKLRDFDRWKELFTNHLQQHKGKYEYDVAVGFSGGKDSSYILHALKKHYNCKVLAVTVSFGFMPTSFALENSKRVAKSLGIDHVIYDATSSQIYESFKNAVKRGRICALCTGLCSAFTRKVAIERHIPFYVLGADRGQMFRSLAPETAPVSGAHGIREMLTPYSNEKTLKNDNPRRVKQMHSWLGNFGLSEESRREIYPIAEHLPGAHAVPLQLQFFLFHAYNEKKIKKVLEQEANWQLPAKDHLHAHHDCTFHDAATYFFRDAVGTTITNGEICVDVREGEISRAEAIQALGKEDKRLDQLKQPYAVFEEYFGIPEKYLHQAAKQFHRRMAVLKSLRKFQMLFSKPKLKTLDSL